MDQIGFLIDQNSAHKIYFAVVLFAGDALCTLIQFPIWLVHTWREYGSVKSLIVVKLSREESILLIEPIKRQVYLRIGNKSTEIRPTTNF